MRMVDLIQKKRDGKVLSSDEIQYIVSEYTKGSIPDYQVSALLMAIYFQKMNEKETVDLTLAMMNSGDTVDLSNIEGFKVDKHSTGGVGDTTTLILGPLVAACGVPVAKMSGRGLGHTGGTIDKLESFEGFHVELSNQEFIDKVNDIGIAVIGQSGNLAPADKKLYGLRDVTATVDNISLIASSIMSKKLAAGADGIVLDVKVGKGAFMKTDEEAFALAEAMVKIGNGLKRNTIAVITNMNEPLGYCVGNALEVEEAIDTLQGQGPKDLEELCLTLGAHMLIIAKKVNSEAEGKKLLIEKIENGEALAKFKEFITSQGGDSSVIDEAERLPKSKYFTNVKALKTGYVKEIIADEIGVAAMILGAGRETKESTIDFSVGIVLKKKVGQFVKEGEIIAEIHSNDLEKSKLSESRVQEAFLFTEDKIEQPVLIRGLVTAEGIQKYI